MSFRRLIMESARGRITQEVGDRKKSKMVSRTECGLYVNRKVGSCRFAGKFRLEV